jgi:DNA excision repair protein ERCC-4
MVRIVTDEREKQSGLPGILKSLGVVVEFKNLLVGDYLVAPDSAVERKSLRDFVNSVYDGRLFKQCSELSSNYKRSFLLIEGNLEDVPMLTTKPKAVYGAMVAIANSFTTKLLFSPNIRQSAELLIILAEHLKREGSKGPLIKRMEKKTSLQEQQLQIISSLPGIGSKLAERLLLAFGNPKRILNARVAELARVEGLGLARAEKIREVLDKEFSERHKILQKSLDDAT